jgi:hypothetical protein
VATILFDSLLENDAFFGCKGEIIDAVSEFSWQFLEGEWWTDNGL